MRSSAVHPDLATDYAGSGERALSLLCVHAVRDGEAAPGALPLVFVSEAVAQERSRRTPLKAGWYFPLAKKVGFVSLQGLAFRLKLLRTWRKF